MTTETIIPVEYRDCPDCGAYGWVASTPDGEINIDGFLLAPSPADVEGRKLLCGSKYDGCAVCDDCEQARDEAAADDDYEMGL